MARHGGAPVGQVQLPVDKQIVSRVLMISIGA
jgi:hypothetical protein